MNVQRGPGTDTDWHWQSLVARLSGYDAQLMSAGLGGTRTHSLRFSGYTLTIKINEDNNKDITAKSLSCQLHLLSPPLSSADPLMPGGGRSR